mgnify:CR=1 FL=1
MDGNAVANSAKQYIILKFDNEQYGIDITYIDNIVRLQKITRVPHAQRTSLASSICVVRLFRL